MSVLVATLGVVLLLTTLFQVRFGHFNILFSLLVIALGLGLFRQRVLWGLWFTALLLIIFLVLPLDRYFLPVIPLLVFAWWNLLVWINRALPKPWGNLAFAFCFCFAIGMNASKVGGIIMQQRSRPFLAHYDRGQYVAVPAMVAEIGNRVGDDGVVLIKPPYAHITEFLSRRRVVNGFAMTPQSLAGHHVYVVEPTDADIDGLLQRAKRVVGPAVWQSGANLSLHETSAAVGSPATP